MGIPQRLERRRLNDIVPGLEIIVLEKGMPRVDEFMKNNPKRKEVRLGLQRLASHLFRGHVGQGAQYLTVNGEQHVGLRTQILGKSEIGEEWPQSESLRFLWRFTSQQNIPGLNVAMDDSYFQELEKRKRHFHMRKLEGIISKKKT